MLGNGVRSFPGKGTGIDWWTLSWTFFLAERVAGSKFMPYIAEGLFTHSLVMGALLGVVLWTLYRYDLCHWLSFGFWSWAAFALYFLITPLIQFYGDPYYLESRLAVTEGLPRMLWVTCCLAAGISVYFWAYFRTVPSRLNLGLSKEEWPPGTWLVLILALAGGTYSLIYFRGAFGLEMIPREIVQGKYKGEVMGYQAVSRKKQRK